MMLPATVGRFPHEPEHAWRPSDTPYAQQDSALRASYARNPEATVAHMVGLLEGRVMLHNGVLWRLA